MDVKHKLLMLVFDLVLPLAVGYALARQHRFRMPSVRKMMTANIMVVAPVMALMSLWAVALEAQLIWLPFLGVAMQATAGGIGMLRARAKYDGPLDRGSFILSAMLSNRGIVGTITVFLLFGEAGFAYGQLPDEALKGESEMTQPRRPRVLLLGDSIRMSYQQAVAELLDGSAEVTGPAENCQFSRYTLESIDGWIAELGTPDIVHWNNGIHDVGHNPGRRPVQFPLEAYLANLRGILAKLRRARAAIIWATSTPVHPKRPIKATEWSWRNEEIDAYNAAACQLMASQGVTINDLHGIIAAAPDTLLAEDMLHLSSAGVPAAASAVAEAIKRSVKCEV